MKKIVTTLTYYENNIGSLVTLLKAMNTEGVQNIIFSSSATVYGLSKALPATEQTPIQKAMSPYGNTKQMGEEILQDVVASGALLRGIALRYFNPIGAHPSALIGELPLGVPNNLVPFITQTFEEVSGKPLNYEIGARRGGDVPSLYADASKIKAEMGWTAKRTMRQAIEDAWRWQKSL